MGNEALNWDGLTESVGVYEMNSYNSCFETFTLNFTSLISHSVQIN